MRIAVIDRLVLTLIDSGAHTATKYMDPKHVIRATRRLYGKKRFDKHHAEVVLTMGRPNFADRQFIKRCQKAGEKFPVRKIKLRFPPKPKKKCRPRR